MDHAQHTVMAIIGAGASVAAGAPSTPELLDVVLSALPSKLDIEDLAGIRTVTDIPLATSLREALVADYGEEVDFELVMAALEALLSYRMGTGPVIRAFTKLPDDFAALFTSQLLFASLSAATEALLTTFLHRQPNGAAQVAAKHNLCSFLEHLARRSRLVVATLNYDTLLDGALPWVDGFVGKQGAEYAPFDPLVWIAAAGARDRHLMMHLHGSLRFGFRPATAMSVNVPFGEPVLYPSAELAVKTVLGRGVGSPRADGEMLPAVPIIVGGHKSPKLMHNPRPYAYYNATSLVEATQCDALLIIGYGFRDQHINAWIDEYCRRNPDGPIAVITRRTGRDIETLTATERYLRRFTRSTSILNSIYEPVSGGSKGATHGRVGRLYLVGTGAPMEPDAEAAVTAHLFAPTPRKDR